MRCARCDRITSRDLLAIDRDGRLVFGWCAGCLEEEGCRISEGPTARLLVADRRGVRRRLRKLRRASVRLVSTRSASTRRLALLGIAGLLAAWALILSYTGGLKLARPGDRLGSVLLGCAGLLALASLGFWLALIARTRARQMGLRVVQVASAVIAAGTLAFGLLGQATTRDLILFLVSLGALAAAWAARRSGNRAINRRPRTPATP